MARPLHRRAPMSFRPRIAVASPHAAELTLVAEWLTSEGLEPVRLSNPSRLADALRDCAFDLLVVDAGFALGPAVQAINVVRSRNAQLPIVVLGEDDPMAESQALVRGAQYVARPVDRTLFVCTVSMAVMESRPTRRSERKRARFDAVVHGVPSHIVDVSREGLRIEIPRLRRVAPPPPYFDVTVPMLGVAINVRRLWTANSEAVREAVWYGGELSTNTRRVELAWFTLVDALPTSRVTFEVR